MRTGAALVQASNAFTEENPAKTWRLLLVTLFWIAIFFVGAVAAPWLALKLACSGLLGMTIVRLFIFYHDYLHGAILRGSKVGALFMKAFGWWILAGVSVWRQTHDYHHKNNGKMLGASIGSYPIVTVDVWRSMTPELRRDYRIARHPITILLGYFTVFIIGMCISPFRRNPEQHKDGIVALLVHFSWMGLVGYIGGWQAAVTGVLLPQIIACGAGSYLFYAQHNFPGMKLRNRQDWDYSFAATRSSSMFDMGPLMHWFTGNIGYHHVHHLNHRIPFYRLPEAMAAMPELQDPGRTSWKIQDILACLRGKVWDPSREQLVSFEEAEPQGPVGVPASL